METVKNRLSSFELGEVVSFQGLSMVPLFGESTDPVYLLLEEALKLGCAHVDEVSESGNVNQLKFNNLCERPVLLLDGEEIRGAKQNRIINLTILVKAKSDLLIPVSCVEAGRWRHEGQDFAPSPQFHFAEGRGGKMGYISENLRNFRTRDADQGEIWRDIGGKFENLKLYSPSQAMADAYEQSEESIAAYVQNMPVQENQVGAIFALNGMPMGVEACDSFLTYTKIHPKIVRSYALDALEKKVADPMTFTSGAASVFIKAVAGTTMEVFDALGRGRDVRMTSSEINGGALVDEGRVIHLCGFQTQSVKSEKSGSASRLIRASMRGRHN